MAKQTKPAKCPNCGSRVEEDFLNKRVGCVGCPYRNIDAETHNALCADIDKGRRYDTLKDLEQAQVKISAILLKHLDMAVRLLRLGQMDLDSYNYKQVSNFLALSAVAKIIKEQEATDG